MDASYLHSSALTNTDSLSYALIKANILVVTEFDHYGKPLPEKLVGVPLVFATNNEVIGVVVFL